MLTAVVAAGCGGGGLDARISNVCEADVPPSVYGTIDIRNAGSAPVRIVDPGIVYGVRLYSVSGTLIRVEQLGFSNDLNRVAGQRVIQPGDHLGGLIGLWHEDLCDPAVVETGAWMFSCAKDAPPGHYAAQVFFSDGTTTPVVGFQIPMSQCPRVGG